jgi:hypothetical protein
VKSCLKSREYIYSVTRDFWKKGFNAALYLTSHGI